MEQQRPLEYTIKIYGEGFTEWFYFDGLRTNNRFRFSMVPDVPKNSRSSYKQNLKLIDKELKKKPQERADILFLVIDTDTLIKNKEQYSIYLKSLKIHWNENGKDSVCCILKYSGIHLQCVFSNGMCYNIDDTLTLPTRNEIIEQIIMSLGLK